MNIQLIELAAKLFKFNRKRKVNKMEKTLGDVMQFTKLSDLIKRKNEDAKFGKALKIVLICTGIFAICVAVGFVLVKVLGRREDDYDLYDDLDNYYDESDHYDADLADAQETDFAE